MEGVLERVTFANEDTGYTIAGLATERSGRTCSLWSAHCWAPRSARASG